MFRAVGDKNSLKQKNRTGQNRMNVNKEQSGPGRTGTKENRTGAKDEQIGLEHKAESRERERAGQSSR